MFRIKKSRLSTPWLQFERYYNFVGYLVDPYYNNIFYNVIIQIRTVQSHNRALKIKKNIYSDCSSTASGPLEISDIIIIIYYRCVYFQFLCCYKILARENSRKFKILKLISKIFNRIYLCTTAYGATTCLLENSDRTILVLNCGTPAVYFFIIFFLGTIYCV